MENVWSWSCDLYAAIRFLLPTNQFAAAVPKCLLWQMPLDHNGKLASQTKIAQGTKLK